jgi:hypothetical protein
MATLQSLTINDTGNLTLPVGTNANRSTINSTIIRWTTSGATVISGSATTTSTSWTCPAGVTSIELLVVAGGGGGGVGSNGGGGGGAGGLIYNSAFPVVPGTTYSLSVGAGGASVSGRSGGTTGSNSTFSTLTAIGGGKGGGSGGSGPSGGVGGSGEGLGVAWVMTTRRVL